MSSLTRSGARSSSLGQLVERGRTTEARLEARALLLEPGEVVGRVDRETDGAPGVGDAALDGLADPPRRVRGELEALAPVELLDRVDEAEVALLHEVEERHARRLVALGDRHDQPEVGLHELALRVLALADEPLEVALLGAGEALVDGVEGLACGLARLDVLGEAGFVVLGQQLVPADVFQVEPNEIFIVPFGAVTYSSHGAFPRVGGAVARGRERPSTVERRGMRPCSGLFRSWIVLAATLRTNSVAEGDPPLCTFSGTRRTSTGRTLSCAEAGLAAPGNATYRGVVSTSTACNSVAGVP